MKKTYILFLVLMAGVLGFQSCDDGDDTNIPVNDFIWKGLNLYYLWQEDVPDLADNKFANQAELNTFVQGFSTPSDLFEDLLYRTDNTGNAIDRWSVLVSDYTTLENLLQGTTLNHGADFALAYKDASRTSIFGYVRYIMPGSDASTKDIHRGDIFYAVNGTPLNAQNYYSLLFGESTSYTLNLADYDGGNITPNGRSVTLTRTQYNENPILIANTYTSGTHKIGYLMYNGFYSYYDNQLNAAFGQFSSEGVTDLVLDLRYNSGGSIQSATYLASMITGQFNGQLFCQEHWNSKMLAYLQSKHATLANNFSGNMGNGSAINSLRLNKVYILTTGSTASASELVINCLNPYIDVTTIGTTTVGKNVGSVTLYDSFDFSSKHKNSTHRYAMQPIVLKMTNKEGFGDYTSGLDPDFTLRENLGNMGVLGDPNEPMYREAINQILSNGRSVPGPTAIHPFVTDCKASRKFGTDMYLNEVP